MTTFYFAETQDRHSLRRAEKLNAEDLETAKEAAVQAQMFQNSVLIVGARTDDSGFIPSDAILSIFENGEWEDGERRVGRPRVDKSVRTVSKSITLRPDEWAALAAADPDGSPTREAVRRLRASLERVPRTLDAQR